jgi:hypothetical protein
MVALYEGDLERAITLLEESLDLFRNLESEPHAAPDLEREGIELSTAIDLVARQAQEYLWLTVIEQGDHRCAVALLEEELRLSLELVTAGCIDTDPSAGRRYFGQSTNPSSRPHMCIMLCGSCSVKPAVTSRKISYCLLGLAAVAWGAPRTSTGPFFRSAATWRSGGSV